MTAYILFHPFKHHLGYIKAWLYNNAGDISDQNIITIKTLGSSQLDMYCGSLGVNDILQQVSGYLQTSGISDIEAYRQWINDGFKLCQLSDTSCFTLRYLNNEKPIHIHPARHAPHTIRIKANALKSIACYMLTNGCNNSNININTLNSLRHTYLQLPPVAPSSTIAELEKVFRLLCGRENVD